MSLPLCPPRTREPSHSRSDVVQGPPGGPIPAWLPEAAPAASLRLLSAQVWMTPPAPTTHTWAQAIIHRRRTCNRVRGHPHPPPGESPALPTSSILAQTKASQRPCAWGLVLRGTVSPHPLPGSRHVFCGNQSEMSSRALPKGDGGISRGHTGGGRHTSRQSFLGTWQPEERWGAGHRVGSRESLPIAVHP